jgi:hypothetical protein
LELLVIVLTIFYPLANELQIEPVRLLEAHMACLRQDYEEWAGEEPEELGNRPTEDEMAAHEVAEKAHKDKVSHSARYECKCYCNPSHFCAFR